MRINYAMLALCLGFWTTSVGAATPAGPPAVFRLDKAGATDGDLARELANLHKEPDAGLRTQAAAAWFLGLPYQADPLGEAAGKDTDPLYGWDRVDCITLLEVLLGFVRADTIDQARETTVQLRYNGQAKAWKNRMHLTLSQWFPAAKKQGLLADITAKVGGRHVRKGAKRLDKAQSCQGRWRTFCRDMQEHFPAGNYPYTYLPLEDAVRMAEDIPTGTLVFFLHVPRPAVPYQVFHASVVMRDGPGPATMVHASRKAKAVVRTGLAAYLKSLDKRYRKWPVAGVILMAPQ